MFGIRLAFKRNVSDLATMHIADWSRVGRSLDLCTEHIAPACLPPLKQ